MTDELKNKIASLPDSPGCYLYYDKQGTVIYVGKAKRLKRRVSSYFNRVHDSAKTNALVRNIADMKYVVVGSEDDAFHLLSKDELTGERPNSKIMPIGWTK